MSLINNNKKEPKIPYSKSSKRAFFTFSPGETSFQQGYLGADEATVSGIFQLRYTDDEPIFAKKIQISFVGKEYVFFAGTLKEGQNENKINENENEYDSDEDERLEEEDDDEANTKPLSIHTAKRSIFSTSIVIWRSQNKGQYEELKSLDLPFKFKLPSNLPNSFVMDKGCGRIYYMLKAIISRQPSIESNNRKKKIKILVPIVHYTITPPPSPFCWLIEQEGFANPHIASYDISLNQTTFGPGNSIIVPIRLHFHESKVYLKNIFVGLKEYHEFRTNKYETSTKKYLVEESIEANNLPMMASNEDNNKYSVEVKLNIPTSTQLVYSVNSTYLTVQHRIKIKIRLGKAPDINLSELVQIKEIVTKDEVFPPLPPPKIDDPIVESTTSQQQKVSKVPQRKNIPDSPKSTKKHANRRLSPFFPLFKRIRELDPMVQKSISMQLFNLNNPENPNPIYNSRSLRNI